MARPSRRTPCEVGYLHIIRGPEWGAAVRATPLRQSQRSTYVVMMSPGTALLKIIAES